MTLDRLIISIVGDIDLEEAKLLLDEMFANLLKRQANYRKKGSGTVRR